MEPETCVDANGTVLIVSDWGGKLTGPLRQCWQDAVPQILRSKAPQPTATSVLVASRRTPAAGYRAWHMLPRGSLRQHQNTAWAWGCTRQPRDAGGYEVVQKSGISQPGGRLGGFAPDSR